MEELQKLAALQSKISLLSRYALSSQHSSEDDLLLAKFVLLLVEYCSDASDMSKKCTYLAIQLQKVSQSQAFLEDLFNDQMSSTRVCGFNKLVSEHPTSSNCMEEPALISLRDLERANSTLEDFCRSYFMFHEMDVQIVSNIFKHLPTLAFVEAFIYKIDEQREGLLLASEEILSRMVAEDDSFQPLHETLLKRNLWTSRIEEELKTGLNYWKLEQTLCKSLLLGNEISISDVMKAVRLKSFDYRVLNLLLYKILDQPVNELHMEFLEASELLVEISDDLFDYEEDILKNSFNVLRMFVGVFGPSKAPYMLAQFISEAEAKYNELFKKLEPSLASNYQSRCQQAVTEGGGKSSPSHPMGSWVIPPLVTDEKMYREQIHSN